MAADQAQVLLYDPSSGDAEALVLSPALVVTDTKTYSSFSTNQVLYVGHFGLPMVSIMFYDPQVQQSTFVAFDCNADYLASGDGSKLGSALSGAGRRIY